MATTRFKGETAGERLDYSSISDSDMLQLRHKPGTIEDEDKGISKSQLLSCPFGVSSTAAGTAAKTASLTDSNPDFILVSGREVVVCFTTANTVSNPTLNFAGSGAIPLYMPNGAPVGAWNAGAWMHLKYFYATVGNSQIQRWILMSQEVDSEVIMASSTVITGKTLVSGASNKIMFTADISGSNTTTVLSLTYNGIAYNVKVGKNGALSNFVASEVSTGVYKYVQAYTTLELAFDGSQFIIIGNPVVLSSEDYTIYADGLKRIDNIDTSKNMPTSNAVNNALKTRGIVRTSINSLPFNGYITSNSSRIYFFVPIKIDGSEDISITELTVVARSVEGKYIDAPFDTGFDTLQSPYSINIVKIAMLGIYIYINKTSSFVNNGTTDVVPNNTPLAVTPRMQITIS